MVVCADVDEEMRMGLKAVERKREGGRKGGGKGARRGAERVGKYTRMQE